MRTKLELIAENMKLNLELSTKILKITSLEIERDLLKQENEKLKVKENKCQ